LADEAQDPKKGPAAKGPPMRRPGLTRRPRPSAASPAGGAAPEAKKTAEAEAAAAEGQSGEHEIPPELQSILPNDPPPLDQEVMSVPPPSKNMTRKELTEQYQPYVRSIAGKIKKTLSKDIEFDDLVSYGMLGLFEAADRYDAKFGANFMTFAYYRIRGAIYDGLRGMGWVSRTEYQRYRFEMQANSFLTSVNDATIATPSPVKKSPEDEINELADVVSGLVTIYVTALDAMEGFQIKDDRGPSVEESLEILQARKLVAEAVGKLPEQEKTLLQLYYYKEMSLEDVGKQLGLSKSWTSRLHTRAIEKLSRLLRDLVTEYQDSGGGGGQKGVSGGTPNLAAALTQPRGPANR
jgi:RNA polymerase sigma factor for flagellar operon FliA